MMYIKTIPENCSGCKVCEITCSLWHWKIINTKKSGIRIDKKSIVEDIPKVCTHGNDCNFECITACKFDAMKKKNGIVYVDYEKCIGCKACQRACPLNAVWIHEKKAYKCDLCNGSPQCIKFCSQDAISLG
ncbi:MAG: 4Fe-4S binding protein [Candidatus Thermoplasmatota archaeon]